jgi:hypothetical protein
MQWLPRRGVGAVRAGRRRLSADHRLSRWRVAVGVCPVGRRFHASQAMQFDPECNMGTATGKRPYDYPGSGTQTFLVVPLAVPAGTGAHGHTTYGGPPSSHLCGSPMSLPIGGGGGGGIPT